MRAVTRAGSVVEDARSAWVLEANLPRPFLNRLRAAKLALRSGIPEQEIRQAHGGVVLQEALKSIALERSSKIGPGRQYNV